MNRARARRRAETRWMRGIERSPLGAILGNVSGLEQR